MSHKPVMQRRRSLCRALRNVLDFRSGHDMPLPHAEQDPPLKGGISGRSIVHFGEFELDLRAAELRKGNKRIRLQEQPFLILVQLLGHPGEVVLREEICKKLWPCNIVVEFDHSINAAVKRLRDALQDSAESPRYIETVARRGYRFIGSVLPEPQSCSTGVESTATIVECAACDQLRRNASIAVLPFANLSGDVDNEYFSDGLAEELINELAHVPGLKVVARTSAFAFKGKQEDIRGIAQALNVENVLEGSVRKAGARVRISAQLITANDGTHLWSERYDRDMTDIFAVQDEIAQAIATALRMHLGARPRQHIPRVPAYEAYLKARHCLAGFTRESLPLSRNFYEQAIALDAGFAPAHSGLAQALVSLVLPGITPAHIAMPLARVAANKALEIDPASQEAQAVLGMVAALYDFDWNEAERRFRLAVAREPVPPYVRWYYSFAYLLPMGRTRESERQCSRGREDDPLSFIGGFHYASALLAGGNTEAGEAYLRHHSEFHTTLYQPYYLLALSQAVRGLHREALCAAEKAYSLARWSTTTGGLLGGLLKGTGEENRANQLHDELVAGDRYGVAMGLSLFHVGCSEMPQAAQWAEKAVEQRDTRMILLMCLVRASLPKLLGSDNRWSAIARSLRFPLVILDN
jgi:TolB-like protein